MFGLGTTEVLIILVLALLVFGPAKLPEIGRQIGGLMREFNKMRDEVRSTFDVDSYRYDNSRYNDYHRDDTSSPSGPAADTTSAYDDSHYRLDQQHLDGGSGYDTYNRAEADTLRTEEHGDSDARPWSVQDPSADSDEGAATNGYQETAPVIGAFSSGARAYETPKPAAHPE